MNKLPRYFGILLIIVGVLGILVTLGVANYRPDKPMVFSHRSMLTELWKSHKTNLIEPSTGRTMDRQRDNITTSEGQSYTMLQAVAMDDRPTFDRSWQWTKDNLQHEDDKLFAWQFGRRSDGTYGILTETGGQNSASDADCDIALALLQAYARWQDPKYLYDARPLIETIWNQEVVAVAGKPVMMANDVERGNTTLVLVNPSYWAPYSYKIFAKVDKTHDWNALADHTYVLYEQISKAKLDKERSSGLMPDWVYMNRITGELSAPATTNLTTNYGYDAMRTPWRLALDWQWFGDERAKKAMQAFKPLEERWRSDGMLLDVYAHDGQPIGASESPAIYGGSIGYFMVMNSDLAKEVYEAKLENLYDPDKQTYRQALSYYDETWAWFGMALYHKQLINVTAYP